MLIMLSTVDINQIREPLTDFYQKVSQEIRVDQVIVFGSCSTGKATEDSDIDVVVVSDDFKGVRSDKRFKILDTAARFIRPGIVAAGFTRKEVERASKFSIIGQARDQGIKFSGQLRVNNPT